MANGDSGQQGDQQGQQQQQQSTGTGTNQGEAQKGAEGQQGQQGQQQQQQQAGSQFTYKEDRSKWIPPQRFNEVNTRAQSVAGLQAQLAEADKRIKALAGVTQRAPEDLEVDEIKAHFAKVYPGLAKLTDEQIERLLSLDEKSERIEQTTNNYWRNHGRQMINSAGEAIADKLGGGNLSERQVRRVARDYIAFVEEKQAIDRHEAGDEGLIEEFVKDFLEDWQEPIRRSVTSTETANRRPIPGGRGRNVPPQGKKKVDYNNPKAVEDAMVESYREHGGTFGG